MGVTLGTYIGAWLHGDSQALDRVSQFLVQVAVSAQARGLLGLGT
jgi:hypothetical protein